MNKQLITIFSIFSITCLGMVSAQESKSFLPEVKKGVINLQFGGQ